MVFVAEAGKYMMHGSRYVRDPGCSHSATSLTSAVFPRANEAFRWVGQSLRVLLVGDNTSLQIPCFPGLLGLSGAGPIAETGSG
jgi:hypothetical protein